MSKKSKVSIDDIKTLFEQGLSTYKIAEKLGCNQSHIYRTIQKWNKTHPDNLIKVRSKSEAQQINIEAGGHQRLGTHHSDESKLRISDTMRDFYDGEAGTAAKIKKSEDKKEEWANLPDEKKHEIVTNMRVAAKEQMKLGRGSKFENYLADELKKIGVEVEQRTHNYTPGQKMEVDIAIPQHSIAIEVDGPTHWDANVYGPEALQVVQERDKFKNDLLNSGGFDVLRLQDKTGACTRARVVRVNEMIKDIVERRQSGEQPSVYVVKI